MSCGDIFGRVFHTYMCGCKVETNERPRYYDHYCATCYREGWTRSKLYADRQIGETDPKVEV